MALVTNFELTPTNLKNGKEVAKKIDSKKKHRCFFEGCHFAFNRPWKLERHIYTHTKQRPFKCDHPGCNKDYTNKSHLQRHKAISHAEVKILPVLISCPFPDCTKVFTNKWSLKRHCNAHNNNKYPYKCAVCDITFRKSNQLKTHLCHHLGLDLFTCNTCKETFKERKHLKRHEKIHKEYICDSEDCEMKFDTWNGLRKHKKAFHPKLYICDFCGKSYRNKYNLSEHVISHLPSEKREVLVCPYNNCERFYFHRRNLQHHINSYHKNINQICEFNSCGKMFSNRAKLQEHQKLHTEPKKPPVRISKLRQPRKDKGLPKKSIAAMLSGLILPYEINKDIAQKNFTPDVLKYLENIKVDLSSELNILEKK